MANKSNFIAATGTYYVMAYLSRECIHAACTFGNAPSVDIVASSADGSKTISIQVKTSRYARTSKEGKSLAWFFKHDITKQGSANHFYIFVDLVGEHCDGKNYWEPTVYIIPSSDLSTICQSLGWSNGFFRLKIEKEILEQYENNWGELKKELGIDPASHIWSKD